MGQRSILNHLFSGRQICGISSGCRWGRRRSVFPMVSGLSARRLAARIDRRTGDLDDTAEVQARPQSPKTSEPYLAENGGRDSIFSERDGLYKVILELLWACFGDGDTRHIGGLHTSRKAIRTVSELSTLWIIEPAFSLFSGVSAGFIHWCLAEYSRGNITCPPLALSLSVSLLHI